MHFTDDYGNNIELPTLTIAGNEALNRVSTANDAAGFKARYDYLAGILPAGYLAEVLGAASIDQVDVVALSRLFAQVKAAYTASMVDDALKPALKMLEDVAPLLERIEKLKGSTATRQGFNRVR